MSLEFNAGKMLSIAIDFEQTEREKILLEIIPQIRAHAARGGRNIELRNVSLAQRNLLIELGFDVSQPTNTVIGIEWAQNLPTICSW